MSSEIRHLRDLQSLQAPQIAATRPDNGWILTFTGRRFWPLDPRPEDVALEDIAHALSMKCRYSGHCTKFYSVAQHSRIVSYHVPEGLEQHGLLHDAGETWLPDVPRPIKASIPGFDKMEARIMRAVYERFGLTDFYNGGDPPEVKAIDTRILGDEMRQLMPDGHESYGFDPIKRFGSLGVVIVPDKPEWAERNFLQRAEELGLK